MYNVCRGIRFGPQDWSVERDETADPSTNSWDTEPYKSYDHLYVNIGIKHGFSCINIRQVPREVLKTEAGGRGFQHHPRDLANVNALKIHVRSLLLHKNCKRLLHF